MADSMREAFPFLKAHPSLIYLDSAATAQKPQVVIDAMTQFLTKDYGTVHRAVYSLAAEATARYDGVREKIRAFLQAEHRDEIIFTRGTTEGINLVASSFGKAFLQPGDEILVVETEHHANIVPWQMICQERGAHLRVVPVDDRGDVQLEALSALLSPKVKLLAVAHVANATGAVHPISALAKLAHSHGVYVLVDAAQSVSHRPLSVLELGANFLVFSSHKMYGPTGVGVLYGRRDLLEKMPPYQGGGDMIRQVTFEETTYQSPPLRFEAGTPSIVEVIGLGAAIDFLSSVGFEAIEQQERALMDYARGSLKTIPQLSFLALPRESCAILTFTLQGCHPLDVGTLLDTRGICVRTGHLCAQPALKRFGVSSAIRMSLGLYNTKEEIDVFVKALKEIISLLC